MGIVFRSDIDELNDDQLQNAIRHLINKFVEKRKLELSEDRKKEIIDTMFKAMRENKSTLTRGEMVEPTFVKKLTLALTMMITNDKTKTDEIFKNIFDLLKKKGLDKEKLATMSPDEFNKFLKETKFTPEEKAKLESALIELAQETLKDIDKTNDMELQPHAVDQLTKDISANLFSLLNMAISGSMAVPVLVYNGGGQIQTDYNPEGNAQIDQKNKIDYTHGDSQGLEAATVQAYAAIPESTVDENKDLLRQAGVAPGPQPITLVVR